MEKRTTKNSTLSKLQKHVPSIRKVVDARAGFNVEVIAQDCQPYGRKTFQSCAIALAAKRFSHFDDAIVTRCMAYLVRNGVAYRFGISKKASDELRSFDKGEEFKPGIYALTRPCHPLGSPHENTGVNVNKKPRGSVLRPRIRRVF